MDNRILEPIAGANPSGKDLRYEPIYSEIRSRVRNARGGVRVLSDYEAEDLKSPDEDWGFVASACRELLEHRSKDLMLAGWLTEAQLALEGFSGLLDGLDILRGLAGRFWETLYPEIEDGDAEARLLVFEWLDTHLAEAVQQADAEKEDAGSAASSGDANAKREWEQELLVLIDCRDSLTALSDTCSQRLDRPVPFANLRAAVMAAMRETFNRLLAGMHSPDEASALRSRFQGEQISKGGLERLLRYPSSSRQAPASFEDDERLHANEPDDFAGWPSRPPAPSTLPPPSPSQGNRIRMSDILAGTGMRRIVSSASEAEAKVMFTLTAPENVTVKVPFELFVWAHEPQERARILARAREELGGRDVLERAKGPVRIASGTILSVRLSIPGAEIAEPEDVMVWEGESTCVSFVVMLPALGEGGKSPGVAHIYANGVQIAKISFVLSAAGVMEATGVRYRKAFASYASADRDAVLGRIQGMHKIAPELEVFLDVLTLRSGQNWEQELWRVIPSSDVFYLFWSSSARTSEWVEKEWRCALRERGIEFIDPVPLESPSQSPPPPELSALHFNDWELAFRRGRASA